MPVVQVDQGFYLHLLFTAAQSLDAADGSLLLGQRTWSKPPRNGWSGDPLDVQGMDSAYDRADLNARYGTALLDKAAAGTTGDCAAAKVQIDWLAAKERAYKTRHATRIRCTAHSAARKRGHGDGAGVFLGSVLGFVQTLVSAAGQEVA